MNSLGKGVVALAKDYFSYLDDITSKEKKFTESIRRTPNLTDRKLRMKLLTHVTYIQSRLSHLLEIAKVIFSIERRNVAKLVELENSLNNASKQLRTSLAHDAPFDLQSYYLSEFMIVRNQIVDKVTLELAYGRLISESDTSLPRLLSLADFLDLDLKWALSVIALQLHEVVIVKASSKIGIELKRKNIEKILGKTVNLNSLRFMPFNQQYDAFSKFVKEKKGIRMPVLVRDMRTTRSKILHLGYNPTSEETDSIITFTEGLLKKLKNVAKAHINIEERIV